jgi:hypothetical protein
MTDSLTFQNMVDIIFTLNFNIQMLWSLKYLLGHYDLEINIDFLHTN